MRLRVAVAHEGAITFHLSVTPHASLAHALRPHPQRSAGCAGAGQEGMTSKCQSRFECSYHALGHAEAGLCRRVSGFNEAPTRTRTSPSIELTYVVQ